MGDEVRAHEGSAETRSIMDAASSDSGAATAPVSLGRGFTGSIGSRWRETEDLRKLNAGGGRTIIQKWAMHQHTQLKVPMERIAHGSGCVREKKKSRCVCTTRAEPKFGKNVPS